MLDTSHLTLRANSLFVSLGTVVRLVVSLVSIPLLVRFLGLERYGIWVVLNSVIAIASLAELGLGVALTNFLSADYARKDWEDANQRLGTSLALITGLGVVTSVGLWLAHPSVAQMLFEKDLYHTEAMFALGVISWQIVLRFWQQWAMAVEAASLRYDIQAGIDTFNAILIQVGIMILAMLGFGLWVLAIWSLLVNGICVILHSQMLKRLTYFRSLALCYSCKRQMIYFGLALPNGLQVLGLRCSGMEIVSL
jgi:O-antigen/teichoic acid export membrane protein